MALRRQTSAPPGTHLSRRRNAVKDVPEKYAHDALVAQVEHHTLHGAHTHMEDSGERRGHS